MNSADAAAVVSAAAHHWTPGAYGVWVGVALAAAYILRAYLPFYKGQSDREDALNNRLQIMADKMQTRIDGLEQEIRDERKRCDEEMLVQRNQYESAIRTLNERYDALQRIILQWQVSTGRVLQIPGTDSSHAALDRLTATLSEDDAA